MSKINYAAEGLKFGIVASRFNENVTDALLKGALECFAKHGVEEKKISVFRVPGAFEIPIVAKKLAQSKKFDAILCVGAVIQGETRHFEYIAGPAAQGILEASLSTDIPVIFSVLTVQTMELALARSKNDETNVGFSGALSAIEMANLLKILS